MSNPSFDLVSIVQTIRQRRRFILTVTVAAVVLGGLVFFVRKKKYEAKTQFILSNPLYGDRNNLFRNTEPRYIDFFAGDDDIDRVLSIAASDTVASKIIETTGLNTIYNVDSTKPEGIKHAKDLFQKSLDIKRTEYKGLELSFTDRDKNVSALVANQAVKVIEAEFRGYYNNIRANMYQSIQAKLQETDSTLTRLTDSLSILRDHYHIYDIISPARQNIITGSIHENNTPGFGKGMEEIQNIESVKDQLVIDRAKYVSLLNEFSTGNKINQLPLTQIITTAKPPVDPKGPGLVLTLVASCLLGLFFGTFYILLHTYYRLLIAVER